MIQRTFTQKIYPTTRELANEIWQKDCVEQVDFLLAMLQIYDKDFAKVCMQLEYIKEHKDKMLTDLEKAKLKDMLKTFVEYLG